VQKWSKLISVIYHWIYHSTKIFFIRKNLLQYVLIHGPSLLNFFQSVSYNMEKMNYLELKQQLQKRIHYRIAKFQSVTHVIYFLYVIVKKLNIKASIWSSNLKGSNSNLPIFHKIVGNNVKMKISLDSKTLYFKTQLKIVKLWLYINPKS